MESKQQKTWPGGKIDIEFQGNTNKFTIGQVIKGKIIISQTQEFKAKEVAVGVYGCELTYFWLAQSSDNATFQGKRPFVFQSYTVAEIENNVSPVGDQSYEFAFKLPEWLPDSMIYRSDFASSIFTIRYSIFAQLVPIEKKDFLDVNKNISKFRANKEIYLF